MLTRSDDSSEALINNHLVTSTGNIRVLGVCEDRAAQKLLAPRLVDGGLEYRYICDRRPLARALRQFSPDLLLVYGEASSEFVIRVLDDLANEISHSSLPVILVADDTEDGDLIAGLRTGVVAMIPPNVEEHIAFIQGTLSELPSRSGVTASVTTPAGFSRFIDHVRRTRRSGVLVVEPRTPNEGRASFVRGKLDRARFLGSTGREALHAMGTQGTISWNFRELSNFEGASGVVIQMDPDGGGEAPAGLAPVDLTATSAFELKFTVPLPQNAESQPSLPRVEAAPRLLLVDDDEAILKLFSRLFDSHGFAVTVATDGRDGCTLAQTNAYDLVLADLNMPHLDGWGLIRALREDFRTRELPVALVSAHDDYRDSLRALDAGAQAYLSKGERLESLVAQVRQLLIPRSEAARRLRKDDVVELSSREIGPQWLLRQLARQELSGLLSVRDGWCDYRLGISKGTCRYASAAAGKFSALGDRALISFVGSHGAEGTFVKKAGSFEPNLHGDLESMLHAACEALNHREQQVKDSLLVHSTSIEVHPELYAAYRQFGPKSRLEAARLICEEHQAPRELIAQMDQSPLEIEETLHDLVRRGVVMFRRI
jgi:DNA-binding response OmpR family regulator